jgi:hypothetical protein
MVGNVLPSFTRSTGQLPMTFRITDEPRSPDEQTSQGRRTVSGPVSGNPCLLQHSQTEPCPFGMYLDRSRGQRRLADSIWDDNRPNSDDKPQRKAAITITWQFATFPSRGGLWTRNASRLMRRLPLRDQLVNVWHGKKIARCSTLMFKRMIVQLMAFWGPSERRFANKSLSAMRRSLTDTRHFHFFSCISCATFSPRG